MKHALALILCLAACVKAPTLPEVPIPLRNPTAPVASQVDASLSRLRGDWLVVQGAGLVPGSRLVFGDKAVRIGGVALPLQDKGQGRLLLGEEQLWVHWLDADNRTAAMGNPEGTRVWIMDRTGKPGERLKAAREILEWYGYDLSRME